MPSITIKCPGCHAAASVPEHLLGQPVKCKKCAARFVAARPGEAPVASATATMPLGATAPMAASITTNPGPRPAPPSKPAAAPIPIDQARALPVGRRFSAFNWLVFLTTLSAVLGSAYAIQGSLRGHRGGNLFAGIEVGSKGVKATVIDVFYDDQVQGYGFNPLENKSSETTIVAGLKAKGQFDPIALKETVAEVARFQKEIREKYRLPPERIFVVGASGLFSALGDESTAKDKIARNREMLASAVKQAAGKEIKFITVETEVELSIKGVVPRGIGDEDAVLIDVGSGSIKAGYRERNDRLATMGIPFGTATFTELVKNEGKKTRSRLTLQRQAKELAAKTIGPSIQAKMDINKPGFVSRKEVYLCGGIVWAMANTVHPKDRGIWVELTPEDIDSFALVLEKNGGSIPDPDLSGLDAKKKDEILKEFKRIRDTFKPDNLIVGAEMLDALSRELKFHAPGRKIYFARYGNLAWLLSYVAEEGLAKK